VLSNQIKKYIAIRPEIKDFLVNNFQINEDRISVIYNPINYEKFKIVNKPQNKKKKILFVGTIDYLRKNAIQDLIDTTEKNGDELIIVGKKNDTYLDEMISGKSHVTYNEPTFHIEKYVQECDETAGILLGRTTIEGWLCGKKGWIYNVDNAGNILSKELHDVPSDVDKFRSDNVAKKIIEEYKSILS
jgi:glycosyltransferase involved in cell wall biosynthesis